MVYAIHRCMSEIVIDGNKQVPGEIGEALGSVMERLVNSTGVIGYMQWRETKPPILRDENENAEEETK